MNRQIPICRAGLEGGDANPRAFWPNGFQGVIHRRILEENNGL